MISIAGYQCNQRIINDVCFALNKDGFAYLKGKPTSDTISIKRNGLSGKGGREWDCFSCLPPLHDICPVYLPIKPPWQHCLTHIPV